MTPTINNSFFLEFFFKFFKWATSDYRRYERANIKIQHTKARLEFLKECLEEQVIPRSMNWLKKLDDGSPFPVEVRKQLKLAIADLKRDLDCQYFMLRKLKRELHSKLPDHYIWTSLEEIVNKVSQFQRNKKKMNLQKQLSHLIDSSLWSKYSRTENVINMSSMCLTKYQEQLLGYGLNFSLPHQKKHIFDFVEQLDKIKECNDSVQYSFINMNLDDIFYNLKTIFSEFLPRRFRIAMSELKKINNIRICKADKGGKVVVMDYLCYSSQMKELLSNSEVYQQIKRNPLHMMQNEFNYGIKKLAREYDVSFLKKFSSRLPSLPYIYGLPKIHKKDIPLRPIISNINAPSYRLSKWLARQLSPLLGSFSDAHLRHNTDLLNFLRNIIPHNNTFISFDVAALFTNVPLKPTLDFLKRKLISSSTGSNFKSDVPVDCLLHLIDLCLKNSCFQFENNYYKQFFGIAMIKPLSPVLGSLFLEHVL